MYLRVKLASQMSALIYLSYVHLFQGVQFYALSKLAKILMVPLMIGPRTANKGITIERKEEFLYIFYKLWLRSA